MPGYLTLWKWTAQGLQNAAGTVDRAEAFRGEAERAGAQLVDFRWLQGEWDGYFVTEAPDDLTMTAGLLRLLSAGNVTTQTMRAYDANEMRQIIQAATG